MPRKGEAGGGGGGRGGAGSILMQLSYRTSHSGAKSPVTNLSF